MILLGEVLTARDAVALRIFDAISAPAHLRPRAIEQARKFAALPPLAFATTKRQVRAAALQCIAEARQGHDPRYSLWLGEETKRAAAAALGHKQGRAA